MYAIHAPPTVLGQLTYSSSRAPSCTPSSSRVRLPKVDPLAVTSDDRIGRFLQVIWDAAASV